MANGREFVSEKLRKIFSRMSVFPLNRKCTLAHISSVVVTPISEKATHGQHLLQYNYAYANRKCAIDVNSLRVICYNCFVRGNRLKRLYFDYCQYMDRMEKSSSSHCLHTTRWSGEDNSVSAITITTVWRLGKYIRRVRVIARWNENALICSWLWKSERCDSWLCADSIFYVESEFFNFE